MKNRKSTIFNLLRYAEHKKFNDFKREFTKLLDEKIDKVIETKAQEIIFEKSTEDVKDRINEYKNKSVNKRIQEQAKKTFSKCISKVKESLTDKRYFIKFDDVSKAVDSLMENADFIKAFNESSKAKNFNPINFTIAYMIKFENRG